MNKQNSAGTQVDRLQTVVNLCVAALLLLSFFAAAGWISGNLLLASFGTNYIPMAPSTVLCIIFLGLSLFCLRLLKAHTSVRVVLILSSSVILLLSVLILAAFFSNQETYIEQELIPEWARLLTINHSRIGYMSPLTAIGFALSGFTLFRLLWKKDKMSDDPAGWSASAVMIIGIFLSLSYIYHSPMLYGTTLIPVALTTSLSFILSASGLIASLGRESFPLRLFSGPSVYARLLRYFIPTVLLSAMLNVWLDSLIIKYLGVRVIIFAVSTIITLLLVFIIVLKISDILSKEIDSYINSLKSSEQTLAASQKLLQDITDNSSALIYALDSKGRFLLINRRLESLFGVPRETLIGKTREVILPPDIAALHRANDLRVIAERQAITFDETNNELDGKHMYLSVKFPLLDLQGGEYGTGGISTDITERKKAEEALQKYSAELEKSNSAFQEALAEVKTLSGMLPICASCKKIRDDKGYWSGVESYITEHSEAVFSHGICPDCERKMYEELEKLKNEDT